MGRRIAGRGGGIIALIAVLLAVAASPAAAKWSGDIARADSNPSSGALVLRLSSSAPTYDLHFGLNEAGYTVSNVSADAPGPNISGTAYPACTPTSNSGVTTHNAGIDCTFGSKVQSATITFTTSPRYPDGGGGQAEDGTDSTTTELPGPASVPVPFEPVPSKSSIKQAAQQSASLDYDRAIEACYSNNSTENVPGFGLYKILLRKILEDRNDCLDEAAKAYHAARALIDPPDQNFLAIAVPTLARASGGPARCPRSAAKQLARLCSALRPLVLRRDSASGRTAAIWGAIVTTLNRLSTAAAASNGNGIAIQGATLRALEAEVLVAGGAQDRADGALATVLRKQHVSVRISAKDIAAGRKDLRTGHLPAWAVKALAQRGISKASLRSAFATLAAPKPHTVTLTALLGRRTIDGSSASGLASEAAKGTAQDLANLASGLQNAGVIGQALHDALTSDASAIAQAGSPSARASAVAKFIADGAHAPSEAAALLAAAAQAFTG